MTNLEKNFDISVGDEYNLWRTNLLKQLSKNRHRNNTEIEIQKLLKKKKGKRMKTKVLASALSKILSKNSA